MEIKKNPLYDKKTAALVSYISSLSPGSYAHHFEISPVIGEKYNSKEYRYIVNRAKRELKKAHIYIKGVRSVGYRVLEPGDFNTLAVDEFGKATKHLKEGEKALANAPVEKMNDFDRGVYNEIKDHYQNITNRVIGVNVTVKRLVGHRNPFSPANIQSTRP